MTCLISVQIYSYNVYVFVFLVYYNISLTRLNLFGIVIAFVIWEIETAQEVV